MIPVALHPGETLQSFVVRLARRNRRPADLFKSENGIDWVGRRGGSNDAITRLAATTGIDEALLRASEVAVGRKGSRFAGSSMNGELFSDIRRICPRCLNDDHGRGGHPEEHVYERLAWRISAYERCAIHDIELVEVPGPAPDLWDQLVRGFGTSDNIVAAEASAFERWLHAKLAGMDHPSSDLTDAMSVGSIVEACEVVGSVCVGEPGPFDARLANGGRAWVRSQGLEILLQGRQGFAAFLEGLFDERARRGGHDGLSALGGIETWLSRNKRGGRFLVLAEPVARFLSDRLPHTGSATSYGVLVGDRRYHTLRSIRLATGLSDDAVANIMHRVPVKTARTKPHLLWRAEDVDPLIARLKEAGSPVEIFEACGVPRKQGLALIAAGLIEPLVPRRAGKQRIWMTPGDVAALIHDITLKATVADAEPRGFVRLARAPHLMRMRTVDIVRAVLDGRARAVVVGKPCYTAVLVNLADLWAAMRGGDVVK